MDPVHFQYDAKDRIYALWAGDYYLGQIKAIEKGNALFAMIGQIGFLGRGMQWIHQPTFDPWPRPPFRCGFREWIRG